MAHPRPRRRDTSDGATRPALGAAVAILVALVALVGPPVGAGSVPDSSPRTQGPVAPDPDDTPLPTNAVSPSLDVVDIDSEELGERADELDEAEGRRDDARRERDGHRAHIADLDRERAETVTLLEQLRWIEVQAGETREAAVTAHRARVADADAARARLGRARDQLRDLVIDAYTSGSSELSEALVQVSGTGSATDGLVRRQLEGTGIEARTDDVAARLDAYEDAVARRTRARRARDHAEEAERQAIEVRQATEDRIVAIDVETAETRDAEAGAQRRLDAREAEVLVALDRMGPARLRAEVIGDGLDFQLVALDAWVKAAAGAPCKVEWWALAGISKIEGRHGRHGGGRLDARGRPTTPIIGPRLDGAGPFARIPDTDGGLYDGDTAFDRAVGPMQFIPSTWARWGRDGDGDGARDPHTIYDAAAAAAAYLCAGRSDLTVESQLRAGYFSYNHSNAYVEAVLAAARGYQRALLVAPHPTEDDDPDR